MTDGRRSFSSTRIIATGVALLALAGTSLAASFLPLGALVLPVALGIACVKAALVLAFFMELRAQRASAKLAALAAVSMLALLVALTAADVLTREAPPLRPPTVSGEGRGPLAPVEQGG